MTEVPHPSEIEAPTTTEVTPHIATKAPATNDMDVTPLVKHMSLLRLRHMSLLRL